MRGLLLSIFMGVVFMASGASAAVSDADLKDRQTFGDYEVTIGRDQKSGRQHLKIFRDGQDVFSDEGNSYRIGLMYETMPADEWVKIGKDITGDGEPNLVVAHWSGGAHCCFTYAVFNIGKDFYVIDVIDGGDGDLSTFEDVDQDGALEFIGRDWSFSYWHASFAASPAPQIVLKYQDGKYRPALNLMEQPLPSLEEQEALLTQVKAEQSEVLKRIQEDLQKFGKTNADHFAWVNNDFVLTSTVWGHMIDLIYTGHPNEAWLFLDKVYPQESAEKELFKKDFMQKLAESQYWDSIRQILETPRVMCPADAMLCPDGSYVSRTGPDCRFASCP